MFRKAKPVWPEGLATEKNCFAAFEAEVGALGGTVLYIAASTFYRLFVNGEFVAFGPARAAAGYARVDGIPLDPYDRGTNTVRIEAAGYCCRSLSTCLAPSFLCAELRRGEDVIACTGRDFAARLLSEKEQKTERYSMQRHFGEVWDLTRTRSDAVALAESAADVRFLPRTAAYPRYEDIALGRAVCRGTFSYDESLPCKNNRYSSPIDDRWGRFPEDEIPYKPYRWIQKQHPQSTAWDVPLPLTLSAGEYALFDFGRIECGFLRLDARAGERCDLVVGYTEYCGNGTFAFTNMNVQNVIEYILPAGEEHAVQSFEPYAARFAVVMVKEGSVTLSSFGIKTFERDMSGVRRPVFRKAVHQGIYEAALRTFAHNAVDLYSDCPSRERAGWLCDSYFTGAAEYHFFGDVPTEDAFLENYRLCVTDELPAGMLPMCYPADIPLKKDGPEHIPQWCMWYVLEVEDYLRERNPAADPALFRSSVEGILGYLAGFENEDGLLENVPGWNFVEWSDANSWTKNVNYPTNFLYAAALLAADRLCGDGSWAEKARRIQKRTVQLSFDGEMFTDNAERGEDGVLRNTGNTSEAGQYYALLFGGIDLNEPRYAALKRHLLAGFAGMAESGRRFVPVNAFIGLYLRLETLLRLGLYELLLDEVEDFFGGMAEKTGTLWENRTMKGSLDHGFASYAAYAMCTALEHTEK